ncbi:MAG: hypothetical protein WC462_00890 [archaeon]
MTNKTIFTGLFVQKGFVFSLEATLSLLLFALMLFALPAQESFSLKELAATQQANDLLRVWSAKQTTETEMISDTKILFENNAELWINETQLLSAEKKKNSIATEGIILDEKLFEKNVKIIIHYD